MGNSLRIEGSVHSHWFPVSRRLYAIINTAVSVPVCFTYRNELSVLLAAIAIGQCFALHCVAPKRLVIWTLKTRLLEERLCTVWVLCIIINSSARQLRCAQQACEQDFRNMVFEREVVHFLTQPIVDICKCILYSISIDFISKKTKVR